MIAIVGMLAGANPLHWPKWAMGFSGFAMPFYSMSQSMSGGLAEVGNSLRELRMPWLLSLGAHAVAAAVMFCCLHRDQRLSAK